MAQTMTFYLGTGMEARKLNAAMRRLSSRHKRPMGVLITEALCKMDKEFADEFEKIKAEKEELFRV